MSRDTRRKAPRGHGHSMGSPTEKAKDFKGTAKKLIKYLSEYKIWIIIVLIFAILGTIFAIVGPKILGNATTELFNGITSKISGTGKINFSKIENILITLLVLYVASSLFQFIENIIMSEVSQNLTYKLRKEIDEKIDRMPMAYFEKKTHGEVLSIITNDVDTLSQSLNQVATEIITSLITVIGIFIMMISISISMTIVALLMLPLALLLIIIVISKSQKYFKGQQDFLAEVNGEVEEMYSGHSVIKAYNAEEKMIERFNEDNDNLYNAAWKSQFLSGMMHPIMNFIGNLGYVSVAILGGYLVINNKLAVGDIQSFIQYVKQFTRPLTEVAQVSSMLQSMMAAAERVFEFLEEAEEEVYVQKAKSADNIKGNIEFKHVKFGYNKDKIVINDFNAKVRHGQKIAIVGPTGAGKTTMVKLLMRFYKVNDGSILVDNTNINDFNREDLRKAFGMVLQDTWLFNGTIMENLRYGNLSATDDEVIEAAKTVYVDHFIKTLPGGYQMILNEDTNNISGGQKQLLTIARAILADPKILILDEATSSVDTRTEILIQKAMDKLMEGRTSFIIAHRLSTIKNADLILVMDKGDIVEQGTHQELLDKKGFYANLYNSQFESLE